MAADADVLVEIFHHALAATEKSRPAIHCFSHLLVFLELELVAASLPRHLAA
jgi:hypothetical protein